MNYKNIIKSLVILLLAGFLQGCSTAGHGRNTMPEFTSLSDGFEGNGFNAEPQRDNSSAGIGLTTSDVDIDFSGQRESCVSVALPTATVDSVAFNLIKTYGALAVPLFNEWAKRQHNGVVLDLRNGSSEGTSSNKAEYLLSNGPGTDVPLVFIWDQNSASRASAYIQLLAQFHDINIRRISSN